MDRGDIYTAHRGSLDLRGYEVVRVQFFSFFSAKSVTFSTDGIRFSVECIRKLGSIEYVTFHVHPGRKSLIVKPCEKADRLAIKWAFVKDGRGYSQKISGAAYIKTLFELFNWLPEYKYRFRGRINNTTDEKSIEFDLREPEMIFEKKVLQPDEWDNNFGVDYYNYIYSESISESFGIETQHFYNLEPGINPTAPKKLDSSINNILDAINNPETY